MKNRQVVYGERFDASAFTNVYAENLLPRSVIAFCEYHMIEEIKKNRKLKQKELESTGGGTLGIIKVIDINIDIDSKDIVKEWQKLIPIEKITAIDFLYFESSPNIRLKVTNKNGIDSVRFKVHSLAKVKNYLINKNMLGLDSENLVSTNPGKSYGVLFQFSEKD